MTAPTASSFSTVVTGIRWATLAVGLALAAIHGQVLPGVLLGGLVLLAGAVWGAFRPLEPVGGGRPSWVWVIGETAVDLVVVASTGLWDSPFVFCLFTVVVAAGFTRGFAFAARIAGVAILSIGIPHQLTAEGSISDRLEEAGQWAIELLLVAGLAGYGRRLFGEAEERHLQAMDKVGRLVEANQLLVSLHRVAQTLPASLNLEEAATSTVTRLRELIDCDVAAVLLREEATGTWLVAAAEGSRLHHALADDQLPPALRAATASSVASLVVCLEPGEGLGPELLSHSGLYAPLRARGALIGLLAVEHHEPGRYGRRELQLLDQFLDPAALALDNARWFSRLRTIGADEERIRIARDMHDRIGQSLASVAFGLDRMVNRAGRSSLRQPLDELRTDLRGVVGEVRDTLCDLRTDVSDEHGLADTLEAFLDRVGRRANIEVSFDTAGSGRLPRVHERELWRIAYEAVVNAERHSHCRRLTVWWQCDANSALLTVSDDGDGFVTNGPTRSDAYGLTGMRERADAIGARLDITSAPLQGTRVVCRLERR